MTDDEKSHPKEEDLPGGDFRAPVPRAVPIPRFAIEVMHNLGKCIPCRFYAFKDGITLFV